MIGRAFASAVFLLLCTALTFGQEPPLKLCLVGNTVTLMWDPNPEADLAGYKLYEGQASGTYPNPPTVLDKVTTYTVTGMAPGTYFFVLTAYNTGGLESGYSNEVSTSIPINVGPQGPPGPPGPAAELPSPRIEFVVASQTSRYEATIAWATDVDCSGTVLYGTTEELGKSVLSNTLGTTDHLVLLSPLLRRTHYFYKVTGVCGTTTVSSGLRSFNTKP